MAAKKHKAPKRSRPVFARLAARLDGWPVLALALIGGMSVGFALVAISDFWAPASSVRVTQPGSPRQVRPAVPPSVAVMPAPPPNPSIPRLSSSAEPPLATSPLVTAPSPNAESSSASSSAPRPIAPPPSEALITPPSAIEESAPPAPRIVPAPDQSRQTAALPPAPGARAKNEGGHRPDAALSIMPPVVQPPTDIPAWRRYAVATPNPAGRPMVAVVIDDMGLDTRRSNAVIGLPGPLTLAFLPYGRDLPRQTSAARAQGHELLVHVSMQPQDAVYNPGPNALMADLPPEEIKRRLDWALAAFDGYVGINNHMGSRFTIDRHGMTVVMAELKARGLLFLDSRTVQHSVGSSIAAAGDVPHAARDVFLDNEQSASEVTHQLAELERIAQRTGYAVAIGHPHDVTVAALKSWLPTLAEKGLVLVPVSAIVAKRESRRGAAQSSAIP